MVFGVTDIKTAFGGFSNSTIVMLASFMAIIAALQKTSFIVKFKDAIFKMASKGGFAAYVLLILIVMLGCSLFGTGSTAYYVLVIGLLSNLPYSKSLPPSKVLMPAGFAANHPLLPFNTALQYGIVIAVLQSAGAVAEVDLVKFSFVNLVLSLGFLAWCLLAYKMMPDHPIAAAQETAADNHQVTLSKNKEIITYICFVVAVVGMILQSTIGDAGYAITGLAVAALLHRQKGGPVQPVGVDQVIGLVGEGGGPLHLVPLPGHVAEIGGGPPAGVLAVGVLGSGPGHRQKGSPGPHRRVDGLGVLGLHRLGGKQQGAAVGAGKAKSILNHRDGGFGRGGGLAVRARRAGGRARGRRRRLGRRRRGGPGQPQPGRPQNAESRRTGGQEEGFRTHGNTS